MKRKVYHFTPSMSQNAGGPPRSVGQLCDAMAQSDSQRIALITSDAKTNESIPVSERVQEFFVPKKNGACALPSGGFDWGSIAEDLKEDPAERSILHVHGMWLRCTHGAVEFGRNQDMPIVLAPRGMAEPWAMSHKKWKKKLAWMLYQRRDFSKVTAFHATAHSEAESIRRLGFKQPIAVIPNGIQLPTLSHSSVINHQSSDKKTALFLSRINPKKGLPMLLDAWARVAPKDWRLVIAGNDDSHHLPAVEAKILEHGLADSVEIVGPLFGEAQAAAYRSADLFVLPSYSENFGIVIAEALGYGVPVLTTTGCPWKELVTENCGWWVEPTAAGIEAGLQSALCTESDKLEEMGLRGRQLVEARYQWSGIAERMTVFYDWLIEGGQQPDFVV